MKLNADEALGGGVMLKVSERKSLNRESEQGRDKKRTVVFLSHEKALYRWK